MRGRFCLMVSIMLLAGLAPLMSPQASADSELSPQGEHLVGDFTWIRGLNGTLFMAKNTTGLHVIDVSNMSIIQSVNCASGWRWADGTRVSADETRLICGDPDGNIQEVYALSN
nr:hypothetical protein [Candidatus Poseidoniaceae archaeon]